MKIRWRVVFRTLFALVIVLAIAGVVAPRLNADRYGPPLKYSIERALGRQVDIGKVRFRIFPSPAFTLVRTPETGPGIVIHEDPTIGIEPMAYVDTMEVRPQFFALLRGKFIISSIRLEDDVSINLAKTGEASEWGRWNFASFVNRSVMSNTPAIHVRNGRIHFKFGDTKSVFYLTDTDVDITPPGSRGGGWRVYCSGLAARADRTSQGLGSFTLSGRWYLSPERIDMDLQLDRTGLGEITALVRGYSGNIHGTVSSRLHFGGPINNIGIQGRLNIEDVHRWDLLPPQGQGWPIDIRGRLDLVSQQLDLQSTSASNATPPLSVRFRATDYLSKPHWALAVNWNRFPVGPLMELATHMGAQFPPKLNLAGTMDGAIAYSVDGTVQGQLAFHNAALTIPDSPPVRFDQAYVMLGQGHIYLSPATVSLTDQDQAEIQADYVIAEQKLDLSISTQAMNVAALRSQAALAAVPWLEQLKSGHWSGQLHYHREPAADPPVPGWSGRLQLTDAEIPVPGILDVVHLESARAQIDGARVVLDQIVASAGKVSFNADYTYEPVAARPHRLRVRVDELDAADLEAELMPTIHRSAGLIARALGRTSLPDWLVERQLDGNIQIADLNLGGSHLENVRARLVWDADRVEFDNLQARFDRAAITGKLAVNLRGNGPVYKLSGKVKGLPWQSGKVDAEGTMETSGTGAQVLANLSSEAAFTASALDFGTSPPLRAISGTANLAWSPRFHLSGLNLKMEDETYTGRGSTNEDGKLTISLSNGSKEVRMTGTLAKLRLEEPKP